MCFDWVAVLIGGNVEGKGRRRCQFGLASPFSAGRLFGHDWVTRSLPSMDGTDGAQIRAVPCSGRACVDSGCV